VRLHGTALLGFLLGGITGEQSYQVSSISARGKASIDPRWVEELTVVCVLLVYTTTTGHPGDVAGHYSLCDDHSGGHPHRLPRLHRGPPSSGRYGVREGVSIDLCVPPGGRACTDPAPPFPSIKIHRSESKVFDSRFLESHATNPSARSIR
jgi:hypothetical protein